MAHFVDPEMLHFSSRRIISHKVIILILPYECPGTEEPLFISLGYELFILAPYKIFKFNLAVRQNGSSKSVHIVENILIGSLGIRRIDLPYHG